MTRDNYEPGLIAAFQMYTGFRIFINVIYAALAPKILGEPVTLELTLWLLVGIISGVMMLVYLSWDRSCQWSGKYFLPIAFIYATIDALAIEKILGRELFGQSLLINHFLNDIANIESNPAVGLFSFEPEIWRVSPPLFVILILISWQYSLRESLSYSFFTAIVDLMYPIITSGATQGQLIYVGSGVLARTGAFVLISVIIAKLMKVQRQQRQQLREMNAKLATYAAMSEGLAVSRERNRLARELHDTLAHTLSAASVQLEAVHSVWDTDDAKAHDLLIRALKTTRNGLTETRRALASLRASPLEDLGLLLALHELGETTRQRCGSEVIMNMPDELPGMKFEYEQAVYRIAQESLENIVRHANAKCVQVTLERSPEQIRLKIIDDGVGFNTRSLDEQGYHFGIRGMRERIQALGGALIITSQPNFGTTILLEMGIY